MIFLKTQKRQTLVAICLLSSVGDASPRSPSCPAWVCPDPSLLKLPPPLGSPHPRLRVTTPGGGQCRQMPGRVCGAGRTLPLCRRAGPWGRGRGWLGAAGSSACPSQSCSGAAACGPSAPPHSFWPCLRQGTQRSWGAPAAGGGQGSDWYTPLPPEFLSAQILKTSLLWEACL